MCILLILYNLYVVIGMIKLTDIINAITVLTLKITLFIAIT